MKMDPNNSNPPALAWRIARFLQVFQTRRGLFFGLMIFGALLAFEVFNYTTTDFALTDLLGDVRFLGLRWATILSLAFCGMDFAGVARLFTPERGQGEKTEVWYLLSAWALAATMNALLTWWGVSLVLLDHAGLGNEILGREVLIDVVPVFVAVLVVLIRVLLIGTFSMAGDRLFSQVDAARRPGHAAHLHAAPRPAPRPSAPRPPPPDDWEDFDQHPRAAVEPRRVSPPPVRAVPAAPARPAPKPAPKPATVPRDGPPDINGHNNFDLS
jgi:hypothetical protein